MVGNFDMTRSGSKTTEVPPPLLLLLPNDDGPETMTGDGGTTVPVSPELPMLLLLRRCVAVAVVSVMVAENENRK